MEKRTPAVASSAIKVIAFSVSKMKGPIALEFVTYNFLLIKFCSNQINEIFYIKIFIMQIFHTNKKLANYGDRICLTLLHVDVPAMVPSVTVDDNTININGNNVTLTLSWGEPFDNRDPIVNYTVSCSGDVTCPPNTTTTRSYTVTNLTPMTNYTFSVVATNSIGSGEAGVVMITTPPGKVMDMYHCVACFNSIYVSSYTRTYVSVVYI